ncbi:MAG: type II secretion system protein GspJ [Phycisphaeraceae bacterium]
MMIRDARGLTLMEVVVAMVVVSLMMAALYAGFAAALSAQRSGRDAVQRLQGVSEAMRFLQADLQGTMQPGRAIGGQWITENTEDATLSQLTLRSNVGDVAIDYAGLTTSDLGGGVAIGESEPRGGDVQEINWSLRPRGDGYDLVRGTTRNLLTTEAVTFNERIILQNIQTIELRYYDGQEWRNEWESDLEGEALPAAVEIIIELAEAPGAAGRRFASVVRLPMSTMTEDGGGLPR